MGRSGIKTVRVKRLRFAGGLLFAAALIAFFRSTSSGQLPLAVAYEDREVGQLHRESRHMQRKIVEETNTIGMKLVRIPAGEFMMGPLRSNEELSKLFTVSSTDFERETRRRRAVIKHDFHLGKHEVTVGEFRTFVAETGYVTHCEKGSWVDQIAGYDSNKRKIVWDSSFSWKNTGWEQTDRHPVVNVTWRDAKAFCEWLSRKEGATYRLPTQTEWEYACRAGTESLYYTGDDPDVLCRVANVWSGPAATDAWMRISGSRAADDSEQNAFGICQMHGNVSEWCNDRWPIRGVYHAIRGGSWNLGPAWARAACRDNDYQRNQSYDLGFRVLRETVEAFADRAKTPAVAPSDQDRLSSSIINYHNDEVVRYWLRAAAQIDALDSEGFTALYWAAVRDSPRRVSLLLNEFGANPNARMHDGMTALDVLAQRLCDQHVEITPTLKSLPYAIPVGGLDEDTPDRVRDRHYERKLQHFNDTTESLAWSAWLLINAGARLTKPLKTKSFDEFVAQLESDDLPRFLEAGIKADVVLAKMRMERLAKVSQRIEVLEQRKRSTALDRIADADAYVRGNAAFRPGQLARVRSAERSSGFSAASKLDEYREELKKLRHPVREHEWMVKHLWKLDDESAERRYDELRMKLASTVDETRGRSPSE